MAMPLCPERGRSGWQKQQGLSAQVQLRCCGARPGRAAPWPENAVQVTCCPNVEAEIITKIMLRFNQGI